MAAEFPHPYPLPTRGRGTPADRAYRLAALTRPPVLAAALLLSACAGDLPAPSAPAATGAPVSTDIVTSAAPKRAFDPFSQASETAHATREVMQNPSLAEVLKPGGIEERVLGRADAPVAVVKYMSLTCPYCRRFQAETFPQLKREYIDTGKVRFILREFPIGHQSGHATIALRCAPAAKHFELYGKFLAQQAAWVSQEVRLDPIYKVAAQVGLSRADFDACYKDLGLINGLKAVKERGRQLGIIGTPNFFINERLVKTQIGMKELREMIDPLLAGRVAGR